VHFCRTRHKFRFWGKVRSGEVRGDRVGKAAPAGRPKSECIDSKQEKYGASMAGRQSMIQKSGHRFFEKIMLRQKPGATNRFNLK
jgi:hypothetical protein